MILTAAHVISLLTEKIYTDDGGQYFELPVTGRHFDIEHKNRISRDIGILSMDQSAARQLQARIPVLQESNIVPSKSPSRILYVVAGFPTKYFYHDLNSDRQHRRFRPFALVEATTSEYLKWYPNKDPAILLKYPRRIFYSEMNFSAPLSIRHRNGFHGMSGGPAMVVTFPRGKVGPPQYNLMGIIQSGIPDMESEYDYIVVRSLYEDE